MASGTEVPSLDVLEQQTTKTALGGIYKISVHFNSITLREHRAANGARGYATYSTFLDAVVPSIAKCFQL